MLTLREAARSGSGSNMNNWTHVWRYEVEGLPRSEKASIAEMNHRWQFLRISNGNQGNWVGDYETPEAALEALRGALQAEGHAV